MNSFRDIIDAFGGYADYAKAVGISAGTASSLRSRNSLPARHWQKTIEAARARGIAGVTLTKLAELAVANAVPLSPLAAILDQLGGHIAVAEDAGIAVTVLEKMEAEGRIWPQYRRQIVDLAARRGLLLDPDALTLTVFPEHPGAAA